MSYVLINDIFKATAGFWAMHAGREVIYKFDGQCYHARQCREHILYRTADRLDVDCTLAVPCLFAHAGNADEITPFVYPEAVFREQVRSGQSRRFVLHDCKAARGVAVLLFAPNGTGDFYDYYAAGNRALECPAQGVKNADGGYTHPPGFLMSALHRGYDYNGLENPDRIEFTWHASSSGLSANADVLTCSREVLEPLCEDVFVQQAWPCMQDPYVSCAKTPDEPLGFDCGSREELERITHCICHADPMLFAKEYPKDCYVHYRSTTPWRENGFLQQPGYKKGHLDSNAAKLCQLAFAHNSFHGAAWHLRGFEANKRQHRYQREALQINVRVLRPSAHERAEALLTLCEWRADRDMSAEDYGLTEAGDNASHG